MIVLGIIGVVTGLCWVIGAILVYIRTVRTLEPSPRESERTARLYLYPAPEHVENVVYAADRFPLGQGDDLEPVA